VEYQEANLSAIALRPLLRRGRGAPKTPDHEPKRPKTDCAYNQGDVSDTRRFTSRETKQPPAWVLWRTGISAMIFARPPQQIGQHCHSRFAVPSQPRTFGQTKHFHSGTRVHGKKKTQERRPVFRKKSRQGKKRRRESYDAAAALAPIAGVV